MKNKVMVIFTLVATLSATAQVPSDCNIPTDLDSVYARDMANMAVRRMIDLNHPDMVYVHIPQAWKDTIGGGLAAIFNAVSLPERDSIFNMYCVHDNTSYPETDQGLLVNVDTSYAWTQAWQNLQTLTGDPFIDDIMNTYSLEVTDFYNWSFGNFAVLYTEKIWNTFALIDSLEISPGVIYSEPNSIIGDAGKIHFSQQGADRYFDFYFEFNDCFDGCDNYRKWQFMVTPDCEVTYLGFEDWGVFGIEPLPEPVNCNLFITSQREITAEQFQLYPNPSKDRVTIKKLNSGQDVTEIRLTDLSGKVLRTFEVKGITTLQMDVSDLAAGTYVLMVFDKERLVCVLKVLKQ